MTLADSGGWEQDVRVCVSNKFQMTPMLLAHKSHHEEQGPKPEVPGLDCTLESPEGQGIFFPFQKIPRIQLPKTDRRLSVLYILTMSQHCMGNIIIIIIGFHSSETLIFQVFYKIYQSDPQFQTHLVIYYLTTRCRQRNKILITNTLQCWARHLPTQVKI